VSPWRIARHWWSHFGGQTVRGSPEALDNLRSLWTRGELVIWTSKCVVPFFVVSLDLILCFRRFFYCPQLGYWSHLATAKLNGLWWFMARNCYSETLLGSTCRETLTTYYTTSFNCGIYICDGISYHGDIWGSRHRKKSSWSTGNSAILDMGTLLWLVLWSMDMSGMKY
jgi:hypothetical protein